MDYLINLKKYLLSIFIENNEDNNEYYTYYKSNKKLNNKNSNKIFIFKNEIEKHNKNIKLNNEILKLEDRYNNLIKNDIDNEILNLEKRFKKLINEGDYDTDNDTDHDNNTDDNNGCIKIKTKILN